MAAVAAEATEAAVTADSGRIRAGGIILKKIKQDIKNNPHDGMGCFYM